MERHADFPALALLDDDELATALGAAVLGRRPVHAWPLASTEEVRLADGRRFAYKAQLPPSVERELYARTSSPILAPAVDLGSAGGCGHLAVEWVDAPTLDRATEAPLARAHEAVAAINALDPASPHHLDLTATAWGDLVTDTATRLAALVAAGRFATTDPGAPDLVVRWAATPAVRHLVDAEPVLSHGDLTPEEVFVTGDGIRVIDWQRPVLGPAGLDLVGLLRGLGHDPRRACDPALVALDRFVLLRWAVVAADDLLPTLPPDVPASWTALALRDLAP